MKTKKVNIYPVMPITTVNPVISSMVKNVTMPVDKIRKCIIARAMVDEILSDGSIVRLTLSNCDTDNGVKTTTKIEEVKKVEEIRNVETKIEQPKVESKKVEEIKIESTKEKKSNQYYKKVEEAKKNESAKENKVEAEVETTNEDNVVMTEL